MSSQRRPGRLAEAWHDVDHAVRKPDALDEFAEEEGREGRLLGRLQDDRAAGRECGAELQRGHDQRRIPRNDGADHADRLPPRVGQRFPVADAARGNRNGVARDLRGPAGVVAQEVAAKGCDRILGNHQRHAVVEGLQLAGQGQVGLELVGQLPDELRPLVGGQFRPLTPKRLACRLHGAIDVLLAAAGNLREVRFGGGIEDVDGFPGGRRDPLAADQQAVIAGEESPGFGACCKVLGSGAHGSSPGARPGSIIPGPGSRQGMAGRAQWTAWPRRMTTGFALYNAAIRP